jgi:hypothetical protein
MQGTVLREAGQHPKSKDREGDQSYQIEELPVGSPVPSSLNETSAPVIPFSFLLCCGEFCDLCCSFDRATREPRLRALYRK